MKLEILLGEIFVTVWGFLLEVAKTLLLEEWLAFSLNFTSVECVKMAKARHKMSPIVAN